MGKAEFKGKEAGRIFPDVTEAGDIHRVWGSREEWKLHRGQGRTECAAQWGSRMTIFNMGAPRAL